METMHLVTRLVIEHNKHQMTAFSARPDAPVQPSRPASASRRSTTWAPRLAARLRAAGRAPIHRAPVTTSDVRT
jgi:hypothetical protein